MIAHLRGKLLAKHPNQVVVETGGVGYEVNISVPTFSELPSAGSEVALHIHTHVREDVIALYGFLRPAEKQLFEKLMTVSGIGAKLAITILSGMAADEMAAACAAACHANALIFLTDVPGVKDAEGAVIPRLSTKQAQDMVEGSIISGGMLPKLEACKQALKQGVGRVRILPAAEADALPQFYLTKLSCGTEVTCA